jgi:RND family efflux transporter MFP subunit
VTGAFDISHYCSGRDCGPLCRRRLFAVLSTIAPAVVGCGLTLPAPPKPDPPAKAAKTIDESQLNTIDVHLEAVRRLAIETALVDVRPMRRVRPYGAEVVLPPANSVVVAAPLGGTVQVPRGRTFPQIGAPVIANEPVVDLVPILSADRSVLSPSERMRLVEARNTLAQARIDAEGQVEQARVQVEAATIALERARRLLKEQAGTVRAVDDAEAQLKLAEKVRENAVNRRRLLDDINLDEDAGTFRPLAITAPMKGIVRTTQVQPGQIVGPGTALFEIMNDESLWVKVAVYVGDLAEIDEAAPAALTSLDGRSRGAALTVQPARLPPTAVTTASAVDLYYELPNREGAFRPGQRLTAELPLKGQSQQRVIPWSAVFHDVYGGQWVYVERGAGKYVRRRVNVLWVSGAAAVLADGPEAGAAVVSKGVAELAGVEFGFAK